ncbi:mannose-1-phosphate guanylyltransferase/mannose-6-phosphate isomerase [Alphaproteobacteria bacterium]|nr:mannose-1-phosphate guanylyltransferase/mannose-6-phosphate isomerase [Alphaproteobacteria bacterium]
MDIDFQIVIMAGGKGTRLWPLSRQSFPKQFLNLTGEKTLFQQTCCRLDSSSPVIIVTNEESCFIAQDQLDEIGVTDSKFLLEPFGKNTAPALTLAALEVDPGRVLVVMPSDHVVSDLQAFKKAINAAVEEASNDMLMVLGVTPSTPDVGFGYIEEDKSRRGKVRAFTEKPDCKLAQEYLKKGGYFWNSGILVVKAGIWLEALEKFRPDILAITRKAYQKGSFGERYIRPDRKIFEAIPAESIDYAVLEKCPGSNIDISLVELNAGWSDVGSWSTLSDLTEKDKNGNASFGDVFLAETEDSFVKSESRFVGVIGLKDTIVVETVDAVLVAHKAKSQSIKKIVDQLKNEDSSQAVFHRKVIRPWGWFDNLFEGAGFKVKLIRVNPGASLSLQKHRHRAEHWSVVRGVAEVTCGLDVKRLGVNQSADIPCGAVHRLANFGDEPLEIIEIQFGDYLAEDDIERLEDEYGRI